MMNSTMHFAIWFAFYQVQQQKTDLDLSLGLFSFHFEDSNHFSVGTKLVESVIGKCSLKQESSKKLRYIFRVFDLSTCNPKFKW